MHIIASHLIWREFDDDSVCVAADCCGKGHYCSRICVRLSASELLRVVTAGAQAAATVEECDVRAAGVPFWVGSESGRLATVFEKSL
ncbi:hypothetical protein CgunFtcFv8_000531 [Champsocephalus gunnari]|uniref:Uncharacterized protein n=1 Tax=Champsocephalus gunnari TaxID=52237 RepID=A0AAN8HQ76_CHAGU|nr:hypothetical protein CgunFtcFv8_000531 [Champsocephalus gunnari]